MRVDGDSIVLDKGVDMSQARFLEWLNSSFKKESGLPFTEQDAFGYIERGNLPTKYGFYKVIKTDEEHTGLRIISVIKLTEQT